MRLNGILIATSFSVFILPLTASAERWVEFHSESWGSHSEKLGRNLTFSTRHYYDADTLKRGARNDLLVAVREVSRNDKYYVEKGIPENEAVYKRILLDCDSGRYEVLMEGDYEAESNLTDGDKIVQGSMYDKLFTVVCSGKIEKKKGKK